jgi:hypothetical protein
MNFAFFAPIRLLSLMGALLVFPLKAENYGAALPCSSIPWRVVTCSRAGEITGLLDSHAELAESAVAFFVG